MEKENDEYFLHNDGDDEHLHVSLVDSKNKKNKLILSFILIK